MRTRTLLICAFLGILGSALRAPAADFDPEAHFPKDCYFYAAAELGELRKGFQDSPLGRIANHPGVREALGRFPEMLLDEFRRETRDFTEAVGMDLLEFLDLFQGKVAMTVPSVDMREGPAVFISVELGSQRARILQAVETLGRLLLGSGGAGEVVKSRVKGHEVTTWPGGWGPSIHHTVLGGSLVLSIGPGLDPIIDRFASSGDGDDSLKLNVTFARGKLQVTGAPDMVTVFVNWKKIREFMMPALSGRETEEATRIFQGLGLDRLVAATLRFGFREGGTEAKVYIESSGGASGLLGSLVECIQPAASDEALRKVPASALEISSLRYSQGKLLQQLIEAAQGMVPEAAPMLQGLVSRLEEKTGLSLERDIYSLPPVELTSFSILPASGGLVPDTLTLARTSELAPHLAVLDRMARKIGADVTSLRVQGHNVAYVSAGDVLSKMGLGANALLGLPEQGPPPMRDHRVVIARDLQMFTRQDLSLAFTALDKDWVLVASTPQAIGRHLSHYSKLPKAAEDAGITKTLKSSVGSNAAFVLLRGGRHLISIYNTALSLAVLSAPALEHRLRPLGINLARLPAGEEFEASFRDGFFLVRNTKEGIVLHGHRVFTNLVGSPTVLSQILLFGMRYAMLEEFGRRHESIADPSTHLKTLGGALKRYAATAGGGAFPYDASGSLAAFQKLLDSGVLTDTRFLVHPLGSEVPVTTPAPGGKATLREGNLSYELAPWKQGPSDHGGRVLVYEKRAYAGGGRNVLFVDLSVRFLPENEFQKLLEEQKARYGKTSRR